MTYTIENAQKPRNPKGMPSKAAVIDYLRAAPDLDALVVIETDDGDFMTINSQFDAREWLEQNDTA